MLNRESEPAQQTGDVHLGPAPHCPGVALPLAGIDSMSPIFTHDAGVEGELACRRSGR